MESDFLTNPSNKKVVDTPSFVSSTRDQSPSFARDFILSFTSFSDSSVVKRKLASFRFEKLLLSSELERNLASSGKKERGSALGGCDGNF